MSQQPIFSLFIFMLQSISRIRSKYNFKKERRTIYLFGSTPISNNIAIPNYRSVKAILCGLSLHKSYISAYIFCSNLRTETVKIIDSFYFGGRVMKTRAVRLLITFVLKLKTLLEVSLKINFTRRS
jgi:hypothetical protein